MNSSPGLDPDMSQRQQKVPPVKTMTALIIYLKRTLRLLGLSVLLFIVYNLPYIGWLVLIPPLEPIMVCMMMRDILTQLTLAGYSCCSGLSDGYEELHPGRLVITYIVFNSGPRMPNVISGKTFGWKFALFVSIGYIVAAGLGEAISVWALIIFQFWMSAVALSRELLEPFFERLPDYRRHPAILRKVRHLQHSCHLVFRAPIPFLYRGTTGLCWALVCHLLCCWPSLWLAPWCGA